MKMQTVLVLRDARGELAQGLRHEAGLEAHLRVAHLALDFGFGGEGRHRVDDDDVDGARADQRVGDFECLFAVVGLRDEQVVHVHAQFLGIEAVEGVFGVDEGRDAARLLRLGDGVDRQCGLARRFGAVDFDDAAFGVAADAEGHVEGDRPRGDHRNVIDFRAVHAHDRPLAEVLLDLLHHRVQDFELVRVHLYFFCHGCCCSFFYRFFFCSVRGAASGVLSPVPLLRRCGPGRRCLFRPVQFADVAHRVTDGPCVQRPVRIGAPVAVVADAYAPFADRDRRVGGRGGPLRPFDCLQRPLSGRGSASYAPDACVHAEPGRVPRVSIPRRAGPVRKRFFRRGRPAFRPAPPVSCSPGAPGSARREPAADLRAAARCGSDVS